VHKSKTHLPKQPQVFEENWKAAKGDVFCSVWFSKKTGKLPREMCFALSGFRKKPESY